MKLDTTTIDTEALERLCPQYDLPRSFHLQNAPGGNGCAGDPPGYPTYFTQRIYTARGNSPAREPEMVLLGRALPQYGVDGAELVKLWRAIYRPLPIDHPRVVAWILDRFRHLASCYRIPKELSRRSDSTMIVWPLPYYELRSFRDDPRFSDAWREAERAAVDAHNHERTEQIRPYAVTGCHLATLAVREIYPDFSDEFAEALIARPPTTLSNWWERHDVPPEPGRCPGDVQVNQKHRDDHCQFCGGLGNSPAVDPVTEDN